MLLLHTCLGHLERSAYFSRTKVNVTTLSRSQTESVMLTISPIPLCSVFPIPLTTFYTGLLLHTSLSPVSIF